MEIDYLLYDEKLSSMNRRIDQAHDAALIVADEVTIGHHVHAVSPSADDHCHQHHHHYRHSSLHIWLQS